MQNLVKWEFGLKSGKNGHEKVQNLSLMIPSNYMFCPKTLKKSIFVTEISKKSNAIFSRAQLFELYRQKNYFVTECLVKNPIFVISDHSLSNIIRYRRTR